ncbi:hypothetical protein GCM10007989_30750 [Devosia pacifica]|uniref:Sugar ABC transporter substrate-binding protein n=1 Tax=Devosia pacifica TaxID=1335967 RepID=A0A918SB01_9HYPH|nr:sugar ABC transporter substrate-binding protein [Devosia pacifica]GHA32515.1 hypothetical protein GCM10007989_30750 [Devosia pacifica]
MRTLTRLTAIALLGAALPLQAAIAQDEPVTLTWTMWSGSDAETAVWRHLADMVTEQHPDITIDLQTASWGDYWTRLPVQAASGQLGDIVAMQSLRAPNFYQILEPLNERIDGDGFDIDAFDSSIVGGLSVDDTVYALPYDVGPWMIFYNKDRFEEAGVELPEPGWTIEDFTEKAQALTSDGNYGFGFYPVDYAMFSSALGVDYLDEDGNLALNSPEAVGAAETLANLVTEQEVAPVVASGPDSGTITSGRFDSGNIAMYVDGPWVMVNKAQDVDFEIGLAPLPRGEGDLEAVTAGSGFGIAATSDNKDAAWRAIQVLTGPEALEYLGSEGRALPARTAQQASWFDVAAADVYGAREALEYSLEHSATYEITSNWNTVENLMNQYFPLALTGNQSPQQVMDTIQSLATQ